MPAPVPVAPTVAVEPVPFDVAAKLHEIGAAYLAAHPISARVEESEPRGILAFGTCERITDSAKASVTKRITRWIDRTYRHEHSDLELTTSFGCVDPDGIVVDVQQDRYGQGSDRLDTGRWWTLRVSDNKIEVLAEIAGSSINDFMEWAEENRTYTTLLADLDGNGTRDALIMTEMHEGGAIGSSYSLSVKDSAKPARKVLAADAMNVDLIPGKRVVIVTWQRDESAEYSCYEPAGTLGTCAEAQAVKRADDARTVADRWQRITHTEVPDRPVLATELALLDVPADQQAPLLAAVPTVSPHGVFAQVAPLTQPEDGGAYVASLQKALGGTPKAATPRDIERAKQWITQRAHRALRTNANGYATVSEGLWGLLYLRWVEDTCSACDDGQSFSMLARWDEHQQLREVEGQVSVSPYAPDPDDSWGTSIVILRSLDGASSYMVAGPRGLEPLPAAAKALIDAHDARDLARAMWRNGEPRYLVRDTTAYVDALKLLGAAPALIAEVAKMHGATTF